MNDTTLVWGLWIGLLFSATTRAQSSTIRLVTEQVVIATGNARVGDDNDERFTAPCTNEDAYNTPGIWTKQKPDNLAGADKSFPKAEYPGVLAKAQKAVDLLKLATPEFKGIQAYAYRSINGDSYSPNGAFPFRAYGVYDAYICVGNNSSVTAARGTVLLNGDTFWITIRFNDLGSLVTERSIFSGKLRTALGEDIFVSPKQVGELRGFPSFAPLSQESGTHEAVLLTAHSRSPFAILTREGYLEARIRAIQSQIKDLKDHLRESITRMDIDIKKIDGNPIFTAQQKASVKESLRRAQVDRETVVATMESDLAAMVQVLSTMPTAERNTQAIVRDPFALPAGGKLFTSEPEGGKPLVTIDKGFFDPKLPRQTIQLITVYWSWDEKHPAKDRAIQQFKSRFDFDALSQMLGK